jgi:uncharacterized membrane protein
MTTPIIVICILVLPLLASWVFGGPEKARFGGVLAIAIAFAFFGVGHYAQTNAMVAMLPDIVPFRRSLILATGVLEFAIAAGFLWPATRKLAGLVAVTVLIGSFPANIYAAVNQTGTAGHVWGPVYLLIRAPLQLLLIGWTWWFTIRAEPEREDHRPSELLD